jgi:hypothetical protein
MQVLFDAFLTDVFVPFGGTQSRIEKSGVDFVRFFGFVLH